jgi:uncharacterized protein (DUF697 family)
MDDSTSNESGKPAQEALPTPEELERERKADALICWATARAGVIVVAPIIGSMALMANEAYMVVRMAKLQGIQLSSSALGGFLAGLAGTLAGQTLATTFPFPPPQIPIGMSVTYAVGKVGKAWLDDGMPKDMSRYRQVFEESKAEVRKDPDAFKDHPDKDQPLGDESQDPTA